ncbi:MAG: hypothetical protein RQ750_14660 [Roseovarius sp.]|nr:hypothetical protein [Roseovarius sp.]
MEGLGRKTDWRAALSLYVKSQIHRPAKIGSHDNFTFVSGCIGAITGNDPARGIRGKYRSEAKARAVFEAMGYLDHIDYLTAGRDMVSMSYAQAGDLAIFPAERMAGLVSGGQIYMMTDNVQRVALAGAAKFYRVI